MQVSGRWTDADVVVSPVLQHAVVFPEVDVADDHPSLAVIRLLERQEDLRLRAEVAELLHDGAVDALVLHDIANVLSPLGHEGLPDPPGHAQGRIDFTFEPGF